ncbi:hypothetical protein [Chroococcidiopsis sp [FACHB-1243]]|nr:hypothetical protein [Chroococcidiopsis sp. [FACHB-1243]]
MGQSQKAEANREAISRVRKALFSRLMLVAFLEELTQIGKE